jgi:hypothetical protein
MDTPIGKTFCIAGPIVPEINYFLPERLHREQLVTLIKGMKYFLLHAPRQSGKTTSVIEFVRYLQSSSGIKALYLNIEPAEAAEQDVKEVLLTIVSLLKNAIARNFPEDSAVVHLLNAMIEEECITLDFFQQALALWAEHSKIPVALFIDEIDTLRGNSLLSVLKQIQAGFIDRPKHFPQSICLIGWRDVCDYRMSSKKESVRVSTVGIKAVSLFPENFSKEEVRRLYLQHTEATGQCFTDKAIELAFYLTQGQPWLVNALAQEACFEVEPDRTRPITVEIINQAKDTLILRRDTHIGSLLEKLKEPRVCSVIDAMISGGSIQGLSNDDIQYCKDLGLLSTTDQMPEIANPIYKQIIPAILASEFQERITLYERSFIKKGGSL